MITAGASLLFIVIAFGIGGILFLEGVSRLWDKTH